MTDWVVVVGRWLIVANRALRGVQPREELHRMTDAVSSFSYMLVPETSAAAYQVAPAASDVVLGRLAGRATSYRGPTTAVDASAQARRRFSQVLACLAHGGLVQADG